MVTLFPVGISETAVYSSFGTISIADDTIKPNNKNASVKIFPCFFPQAPYPRNAVSRNMALMNVQLICQPIVLIRSGEAIKKKDIDAIQTVAKIAARKYHIERTRSFLVEPKNTIAPDKKVNTDTVVNRITINCTSTSFYAFIIA